MLLDFVATLLQGLAIPLTLVDFVTTTLQARL